MTTPAEQKSIAEYRAEIYEKLWEQYGATPEGMGWKDHAHQIIRFLVIVEEIRNYFPTPETFSVLDVGAGYGALTPYLRSLNRRHTYMGLDANPAIGQWAAEQRLHGYDAPLIYPADFLQEDIQVIEWQADVVVASGLLSYQSPDEGFKLIDKMWRTCRKMLVFNFNATCKIPHAQLMVDFLGCKTYKIRHDYLEDDTTVVCYKEDMNE